MRTELTKEQIERKLEALARGSEEVLRNVKGNLGLAKFISDNKVYASAQELNQKYVKLTGDENKNYTEYGMNVLDIKDDLYDLMGDKQ